MLSHQYCWLFLLLLSLCPFNSNTIRVTAAAADKSLDQYLYLKADPESVFPIVEYKANTPEEADTIPDFLDDSNYPYPRVVEFYAHWCPHCQKFKPKYIEFARHLREITEPLGIPPVEVRAVSCVPNRKICQKFQIRGYPSVRLFAANSIEPIEVAFHKLHPKDVLSQLGISTEQQQQKNFVNGAVAVTASDAAGGGGGAPIASMKLANGTNHFQARSQLQVYQDAHLSLDFVLRHGIYVTSPTALPDAARDALQAFLHLLLKALPTSSSMYPLVQALVEASEEIVQSDAQLQGVLAKFSPPTKQWSPACQEHDAGYTCGLWTLFHILSVGMVEWNVLAQETADDEEAQRVPLLQIADGIRNFLEHFFQCEECRVHFLAEYERCTYDRCNRLMPLPKHLQTGTRKDWQELPLWLYETHNGVNTRLRQERLDNKEPEDTTTPWQVQWPPVSQCPSCWLSEGRWDEDQIYRFLRLQYWPQDYQTTEIQKHFQELSKRQVHPDVLQALGSGQADSSSTKILTPPLFASVGVAVVVFFLWYRKRRRYLMRGMHKKKDSLESC